MAAPSSPGLAWVVQLSLGRGASHRQRAHKWFSLAPFEEAPLPTTGPAWCHLPGDGSTAACCHPASHCAHAPWGTSTLRGCSTHVLGSGQEGEGSQGSEGPEE